MIELDPVEVLSRFSVLSGLEDAERCLPLCGAAARQIGDSERGGCPETGREALNAAAGKLWRNAAAAASPYLKDPGPFRFGRIRP